MQFKFIQLATAVMATLTLVSAVPVADAEANEVNIEARATAGTAWAGSNRSGDALTLSTGKCHKFKGGAWEDEISSIEVNSGFTCSFYFGRHCASVRRITVSDSFIDLTKTATNYNNEISSYKCKK